MPYYVNHWVRIVRPFDERITIGTEPARRYSNGAVVECGWVDTVDNVSRNIYGPFETREEAKNHIKNNWRVRKQYFSAYREYCPYYEYRVLSNKKAG